ncbi:6-phosphogluconolactonase [uncultured Abyssibacter sp.]|uniref:6-phosphogluconolactonase n=1 Tax=uncultured Abyssibacter sp. TaxID=2320202 RepID=UPI0032B2B472
MAHDWIAFDDRDALAQSLADTVADILRNAIETRQRASLVVSGGRTPVRLFGKLAAQPLDWSRVHVLPADERWVDESEPASNVGLIRRELARDEAANAHVISLKTGHSLPESGQMVSEARVAEVGFPLDVVVLGMGTDGHTASLFPDAPELHGVLDSEHACEVVRPPSQPTARMTLTPVALNNARHQFLHIEGEDKRETFEQAAAGRDIQEMPVRSVIYERGPRLQVYWAP